MLCSRGKVKWLQSHRTPQSTLGPNRMSWMPLLILSGPGAPLVFITRSDCDESQGQSRRWGSNSCYLSPSLFWATHFWGGFFCDRTSSGALINQTSSANASFRPISLVQLYRDVAIKTKRQRETKKEMKNGALNKAARLPKAICSCVPHESESPPKCFSLDPSSQWTFKPVPG